MGGEGHEVTPDLPTRCPMTVRQLSKEGNEAKSSPTTPSNGSSATHSASKAVVPHPSVGP
jgi:hypothetical protein